MTQTNEQNEKQEDKYIFAYKRLPFGNLTLTELKANGLIYRLLRGRGVSMRGVFKSLNIEVLI